MYQIYPSMLFSIGAFLILLSVILGAALVVLWLWMLIDCLKRPDDKFAYGGNNAKIVWILVIILTGLIGALIYYFLIKKTDNESGRIVDKNLIGIIILSG